MTNNGNGNQSKFGKYKFLQGHCLDKLKELPDESIHTIITSPPYYGLRRYGTISQVWPGDKPLCGRHKWITKKRHSDRAVRQGAHEQFTNDPAPPESRIFDDTTCERCGAWRGELGLEPTPELYISHLLLIFREARRVLRHDGTLWLNLGDSYWGGKGASGGNNPQYLKNRRSNTITREAQCIAEKGWIKPGDGRHSTIKPKDLIGIPWMAAFALRADGWYLRADIIWSKANPMPESVRDRPTRSHEYFFLLTKSKQYFYDADAIKEPCSSGQLDKLRMLNQTKRRSGKYAESNDSFTKASARTNIGRTHTVGNPDGRNRRTVWNINTGSFHGAHFATFPQRLVEPCILAGTSEAGCCPACGSPYKRDALNGWVPGCHCNAGAPVPCTVLDIFNGAATTGIAAVKRGRNYIGIELKPDYVQLSVDRIEKELKKAA